VTGIGLSNGAAEASPRAGASAPGIASLATDPSVQPSAKSAIGASCEHIRIR
jgi:hypothetical protein